MRVPSRSRIALFGAVTLFAAGGPSGAEPLARVAAKLSIEAIGFPPISVSNGIEVDFSYGDVSLASRRFEGVASPASVMSSITSDPEMWAAALDLDNGAGDFAPLLGGGFGGVMPLSGILRVCLFGSCDAVGPEAVAPLSPIGVGGAFVSSNGAIHVTVQGAAWTTQTIQVGAQTAHGSRVSGTTGSLGGDAIGAPWFRMNLVTPIFVSTNQGPLVVNAAGRIELRKGSANCDDGVDDDGDGAIDHPDDPGCANPDDGTEALVLNDGAEHVFDRVLPGETLVVASSSGRTTLEMVAPAAIEKVQVWDGGLLRVEGGSISEDLTVFPGGESVVTGGSIHSLALWYEASVVLRGSFDRPYGPITDTAGRITGTLADGTPIDATFSRDNEDETASLVLPEPGASLAGLGAILALAIAARRRTPR